MLFAACDTNTPEPISNGNECAKSEPVSQIIESTAESSAKDEHTEEPREQSEEGTVSEPFISMDPESFPYRLIKANNAKDLAAKIVELNDELNKDDIQKFDPEKPDYYSKLGEIIADGYILNPSCDGIYAELPEDDKNGSIEAIFRDDGTATIIYYCRNDDTWLDVQVKYLNNGIKDLMAKHGIDGFRMYYAKDTKPLKEYNTQELDAMPTKAAIGDISIDSKQYNAIKYGANPTDGCYTITIEMAGKVVNINYMYKNDKDKNPDDILKTIKFETVSLK